MIPLFSVNAFKYTVPDWNQNRDKILDLIPFNSEQWTKVEPHIAYTDYFNDEVQPYRKEFLEIVSPILSEFRNAANYKFNDVGQLWCQAYNRRDYHVPHDHGPVGYSCVFYAKMSEEHPSTLFFSPFSDETGFKTYQSVPCVEGDLLIFPAHLMHMAPPHDSEDERIIISFNLI